MTNGAEEKLARVTYLPGVQQPSAPLVATSEPAGERIPLEAIPGLVKASDITTGSIGSRPDDLPGKRFAGHTGEIEPLRDRQKDSRVAGTTEPRSARAHNVSMNALARRGVSSAEMASLLARRELDAVAVETEINRLEDVGLLDDHELARTLVRTLRDHKGLGAAAIKAELRRRRIEPEAIEDALGDANTGDADELIRARDLAIKRAPQLRSLDPETARRRLGAYLMRKGYSGSIVASAVASALAPNHPALRSPGARDSTLHGSARGNLRGTGPRFE